MPLTRTRADALACYLTGAASDGAAQADPDLALGNYRSGTRALGMAWLLNSEASKVLSNVRMDFASAANGAGTGTLSAPDEDSLAWAAPGDDSAGPTVSLANGESRVLEADGDPGKFVAVTRLSADNMLGRVPVELGFTFNDVLGQLDGVIGTTGETYRCLCFKNGSAQTLTGLKFWLGTNTDAVEIASESPSAQPSGFFQTTADEETAPTGVSFVAPTSAVHVDVVTVAKLGPNEIVALWVKRDLTAAAASPRSQVALNWSYTAVG